MDEIKRRDVLQLGLVTLGVSMAGGLVASNQNTAGAAEPKPKGEPAIESPKKLSEGLTQLERLLGKFDSANQRDFTSVTRDEEKMQPGKDKSIVRAARGVSTLGTPYRLGEALAFDMVELWESDIFDLDGNDRTLSHTQHSHRLVRYVLRPGPAGNWLFDASFVSSGSPRSISAIQSLGSVKWYADGVELIFTTAASPAIGLKGERASHVNSGRARFMRKGDDLTVVGKSQTYELARDPSGDVLQVPDFAKPVGKASETIFKYVLSSNLA